MNRLPDEVLLMIFLLCKNDDQTWEMLRYIHLTWVCRRWRLLALDYTKMWTWIDLSYRLRDKRDERDVLEEFMRRSKGAKLSVAQQRNESRFYSMSSTDETRRLKELVGSNFGRLASLELQLSQKGWEDILPLMKQPAPFLRRCHLTQASGNNYYSPQIIKSFDLPDLFSGTAQLRELMFQNVHTSWDTLAPMIQGLRKLKLIMKKSNIETTQPTMEQILHILEVCPELEILDLETYVPTLSTTQAAALAPMFLTMARLSHILVHSISDASVLGYLTAPVLKQLLIGIDGIVASADLIDDIARCIDLSALREVTVGPQKPDNYNLPFGFRWAYGKCNISDVPIGDSGSENVSFQIKCFRDVASLDLLGQALMARAINVSTLTLRSGPRAESRIGSYKEILRHADGIRNLIISNQSNAVSLFKELADPSVCPDLESLTYEGCGKDMMAPGKQLVSLAKARRNGSMPIKHIKLVQCPQLQKFHIGQLEKLGVDLQASDVVASRRSRRREEPPRYY